ncbi:cilia- and flagella-associated protein 100-like [Menidia menidia]
MMEKMAENTLDPEDLQASKVKLRTEQESYKINRQKILTIEQKKATQQIYIKDKKLELMKLDERINIKEQQMCALQNFGEGERQVLNEYLIKMRRKPKDAEELLEKAVKDKLETSVMIERLFEETRTLKSELNKIEDVQHRYKWYKSILLKLSPYEWLEAQDAEALTAKIVQKEEISEPKELAASNSPEKEVSLTSESTLSSTPNNTE